MRAILRRVRHVRLEAVMQMLASDAEWEPILREFIGAKRPRSSIHLAVFIQPFLAYILDGRKTVESRFSAVRIPPYGQVSRGDLVLLKESGGPVIGVCEIGAAWFYRLEPESWSTIRREFTQAMCAGDPEFWRNREGAAYASLMCVARARRFLPVPWPKRDRRGWVVLQHGTNASSSGGPMKRTMLAFSGGIASGKSTISTAVAQVLRCPRVSFGTYIRKEASRRGLGSDRGTLQALGEKLVEEDARVLCAGVLAQVGGWSPGAAIVVDGVRHADVARMLRAVAAPSEFRLIHVAADGVTRAIRFAARGEDAARFETFDEHSTERETAMILPEMADLVVDGKRSLNTIIEEVVRWADGVP